MPAIHLKLEPSEALAFDRPGDQVVNVELKLHNPLSECVHYKIKTTAPKRYCVRPNGGKVAPGETATVLIILQQVPQEDLAKPCKDKFLVQSRVAPESADSKTLWTAAPADEIGEGKLKCVWNLPYGDHLTVGQPAPAPATTSPSAPAKTAEPVASPAVASVPATTDLQAIKKENAELTARNNALRKELEAHKRGANQRITDTHGRAGGAMAVRQSGGINWQLVILAILIGWYLGHYVI